MDSSFAISALVSVLIFNVIFLSITSVTFYISQKNIKNNKSIGLKVFIASNLINAIMFPYLILATVMVIVTWYYFIKFIFSYHVDKLFDIFLILNIVTTVTILAFWVLLIFFFRNIIKEITKVHSNISASQISFIVKICTVITLLFTGLQGVFNSGNNYWAMIVTISSFITLIFSVFEIGQIYKEEFEKNYK
ncbi:hypothetical protein [Staphylococcus epidermidis]|uniref:hypothetical protein n=1 Tax=Staphylococcus epidermidis TaxID=1282 RepID=UPI0018877611|nr:hypothetical protein [Staphylococcus epidermidis]MBF2334315.1 hypothetical protein [Staphylococcus epidermidis]MBF2338391.1 hypothetical protein [Staphylococcus epidermidis]MBF2343504.1 hypothetical protein [Staphylococcus epidermidis]MCG1899807.1 hypothetical protein [Staphylococcus epidermidis]